MCRYNILLAIFASWALGGVASSDDNNKITVETTDSAVDEMSLFEFLEYINNPDIFHRCNLDGLEKLVDVWSPNSELTEPYRYYFSGYSGDELAFRAIEFAEDLDIELPPRDRDRIVMEQFKFASEDDSPVAMNEIGASLLYCYQHIEQDIDGAFSWLTRASDAGDGHAKMSLARIYIHGLIEDQDAAEKVEKLLAQCAELELPECLSNELAMERQRKK